MKTKARVRVPGFIPLIMLLCGVLLSLHVHAETRAEERIPFALPALKAQQMAPVFFSHERHVEAVEAAKGDCTTCHIDNDKGMSEYFMKSESMASSEVVPYVHAQCVACHASVKTGKPTGPLLASCRSCHNDSIARAQLQKPVQAKN